MRGKLIVVTRCITKAVIKRVLSGFNGLFVIGAAYVRQSFSLQHHRRHCPQGAMGTSHFDGGSTYSDF